jgi:hypothetical protein
VKNSQAMTRYFQIFLKISLAFYIIAMIMGLQSLLSFGYGLGDFFYLLGWTIWTILLSLLNRYSGRLSIHTDKVLIILIFVLILFSAYFSQGK